jgi:anti-sigma-K factor RskA
MTEDDQTLAAEYALGVLDADGRREAEQRVAHDPAFAAEVATWQARLAPLADRVPAAQPSAQVWQNIERALGAAPRAGLWDRVAFWRWLSLGTAAVAACLVAFIGVTLLLPNKPLIATLTAPVAVPGGPVFVANYDPASDTIMVLPSNAPRLQTHVPELWLIPPDGKPRSLGLLDSSRPVTLRVPPELRAQTTPQATLAVTMEPPGGAPGGNPTGPVIAQGKLARL